MAFHMPTIVTVSQKFLAHANNSIPYHFKVIYK